jgi:DNA-binding response OmpR family regulator
MAHLLLVEDELEIAEPLAGALRREGYTVSLVGDGASALKVVRAAELDLVILDLGLPDMNGLDVCRHIRAERKAPPVLMLTARSDELDIVMGLDAGADDYLVKPFRLAELSARIRALLRRATPPARLEMGPVKVDLASRRVHVDDDEIELTAKEFDLLALLMATPGEVVTRERIMEEVWHENWYGSTKTLDVHIASLRRKLGAAGPQHISTVRSVGYRFERG